MLNLCELLILELKSTGKEEILKEIKKLLENFIISQKVKILMFYWEKYIFLKQKYPY